MARARGRSTSASTRTRVRPADHAAWRAWLVEHHATVTEVTVEFARKDWKKPTVTYVEAVEEALCFGWIDGVKHKVDAHHYSHRFTPRRAKSAWSPINKRRTAELAGAGRLHPSGIAVIEAAKRDGSWNKLTAADLPAEMPAELAAALTTYVKAKRAYDALTQAQQKLWWSWVGSAKQATTRVRRAAIAAGRLQGGGKTP